MVSWLLTGLNICVAAPSLVFISESLIGESGRTGMGTGLIFYIYLYFEALSVCAVFTYCLLILIPSSHTSPIIPHINYIMASPLLPFLRPKTIEVLVLVHLSEMLILPNMFVTFLVSPVLKSNVGITLL